MKLRDMGRHADQIHKLREKLGDHVSPVDDIKRPEGTKKYLYERRIRHLKRHEEAYERLLEEGLLKYLKSKRRN